MTNELKAPDVAGELARREAASAILQTHLGKQGFGGSLSASGYFCRRDQLTVDAMLDYAATLTTNPALIAENERLKAALGPFVAALGEWGDDASHPDRWHTWEHPISLNVKLGDFRRARSALTESPSHGRP